MILNKCRMWLQVLTVAELVDGYGHSFHNCQTQYTWPKQGKLPNQAWELWRTALLTSFPIITRCKLQTPLGDWNFSSEEWEWYWNDTDMWLFQHINEMWKIWLPSRWSRHYSAQFSASDHCILRLPSTSNRACVSLTGNTAVFWGSRATQIKPPHLRGDFFTFVQQQQAAQWAFI